MSLFLWAVLLILQNAAFTWVSRARNSGSLGYHAIASVFSNGVFFACNLFLIRLVTLQGLHLADLLKLGAIYVASTVTGSVLMHFVSMRFLEKGKRKVGAQ
jgi:hypothetical protein